MPSPNFVLLYVHNTPASAAFYADLLELSPVESSPSFAMFKLESGVMLGLWSKQTVAPVAFVSAGSGELAFAVSDRETLQRWYQQWSHRGLAIAQPPTAMDFGYTFLALDPDGHRLRVFAPSAA